MAAWPSPYMSASTGKGSSSAASTASSGAGGEGASGASDVAEFEQRYATTLDDDLMSEEPTLAAGFEIYTRYLQRVDERIGRALQMLDGELDFDDAKATVDP